jgi:hypothetical protein
VGRCEPVIGCLMISALMRTCERVGEVGSRGQELEPTRLWNLSGDGTVGQTGGCDVDLVDDLHFGGMRPWLLCPECGRRCANSCRLSGCYDLICRRCAGLTYQPRQGHRFDRLRIVQKRLRAAWGQEGAVASSLPR